MLILSEHDAARLGVGGAKKRQKRGRNTRPDIPSAGRAAKGEGDRVPDLMILAAAGWVRTNCQGGQHWMTHRDGHTTTPAPSYRQMLDEALKL